MPADRSSYNQPNFSSARGRPLAPYPSAKEAFRWSNTHSPDDNFSSLGLSDFFITHRCVAHRRLDWLALPSNTQELLTQGVQVGLERREPYNPILEVSISYAGAAAVAIIDELGFVNERQDERMEGIKEGVLGLMERVSLVEEENCQLREVNRNLEEHVGREGERICSLERTIGMLRMLINSLVERVGLVQNDIARINHCVINNWVNHHRAKPHPEQVQMLVEYEGQLFLIEEPIDLAERRPTPHPHMVINLTDEDDEVIPDSEGLFRDFSGEEEEQARNEEDEMIEAKVSWATADPAPEYLLPYQDPPGIDNPFVPK